MGDKRIYVVRMSTMIASFLILLLGLSYAVYSMLDSSWRAPDLTSAKCIAYAGILLAIAASLYMYDAFVLSKLEPRTNHVRKH